MGAHDVRSKGVLSSCLADVLPTARTMRINVGRVWEARFQRTCHVAGLDAAQAEYR